MMLGKFPLQQGGYLLYDITKHDRTFPSQFSNICMVIDVLMSKWIEYSL
jgi:hypothetical protein